MFGRRGGEADDGRVEVLQHLAPQAIDGAVAFVGDDDVEGLRRQERVVGDRRGLLEEAGQPLARDFIEIRGELFPLEDGVEALDGADADPRCRIDGRSLQMLNDKFLGELMRAMW